MASHPNRSKKNPSAARNPKPAEIVSFREKMQGRDLGITEGQTKCAGLLHTTLRTWQQWETGDRRMHPAFWELVQMKANGRKSEARQ